MSDIIPYRGQPLERITSRDLVRLEDLKIPIPRFYLAGNVYVGTFNQAGFVIVDNTPELRPSWIGSDYMSRWWTPERVQDDIDGGFLKEEERGFYDTTGGMAALRFFAISKQLMEIFDRDSYLGLPMIRKICSENIVPNEFYELEVFPEKEQSLGSYGHGDITLGRTLKEELERVVNIALRPVKERTGAECEYFPYVVYFPTQLYGRVTQTLEESVQEAVARFDEFGRKFSLRETHTEIPTNPVLLEGKSEV